VQIPQVTFTSAKGEGIHPQFTANANHCSDLFVRFLLDDFPQGDWIRVGPGQTTPTELMRGRQRTTNARHLRSANSLTAQEASSWRTERHLSPVIDAAASAGP
jgi:hypothetical protein